MDGIHDDSTVEQKFERGLVGKQIGKDEQFSMPWNCHPAGCEVKRPNGAIGQHGAPPPRPTPPPPPVPRRGLPLRRPRAQTPQ